MIASAQKRCRIRIGKLLMIACLAPEIATAIVKGRQPLTLTSRKLLNTELPLCWADQKRVLGFV
jgi:site-specific DNA recombinase